MLHGPSDNEPIMPVAVQRTTKAKQVARSPALELALQKHVYTDYVGDVDPCSYCPRRQVISGLSNLISALNTIPYGVPVHILVILLHNQVVGLVA